MKEIENQEDNLPFIQTPIFRGLTDGDWEEMKKCSCIRQRSYEKNSVIFHMGDTVKEVGIVLSGSVNVENVDLWDNKSILSNISQGQVFAETYAFCQEPLMVDAVAAEACRILFLNLEPLMNTEGLDTSWKSKILRNLLSVSFSKNLILSNRIFCTTAKTIRGRLLVYLSSQSVKAKSPTFQIPFNRQQLADYLNLDRSALSKELGKMQEEGLIKFHKNTFHLLNPHG